jgi:hypothetical protein
MKIASSSVALESKHVFSQTYSKSEILKIVGHIPKPTENLNPSRELIKKQLSDYLELSKEATNRLKNEISKSKDGLDIEDISKLDIPENDKQELILLAKMVKALTGKDIKIVLPKAIKLIIPSINIPSINLNLDTSIPKPEVNWAARFSATESYHEEETLSFKAKGVINTTDGKQIQFESTLNMSREFATTNSIDISMGNAKLLDPIVINYGGPAAQVTQTKFNFDLDSDGKEEHLSTLAKGSGFLALDLNGDGQINNGSELFGTKSNNGFKDLAEYDSDHNNWIDENDPVFKRLLIWSVNEDGTKDLVTLGDKGIGAIYLGNVAAAFDIHDSSNNLQAHANSAGIFLKENGTSGTVQQVDYVV